MARRTLSEQFAESQRSVDMLVESVEREREENRSLKARLEDAVTFGASAVQRLKDEHGAALTLLRETNAAEAAKYMSETDKSLKYKDDRINAATEATRKLETEIEQLHAMLDGIPGAPGRQFEKPGSYAGASCSIEERSIVARIAGALVIIARN